MLCQVICCTIFRPRSHSQNMLNYTRFSKNENQLGKRQARLPLVQAYFLAKDMRSCGKIGRFENFISVVLQSNFTAL